MKILSMIIKDLKLFIRDKKTLGLIILTPLLIMAIMGVIFSGTSSEDSITGVTIALCNLDSQETNMNEITIFEIEEFPECNEKQIEKAVTTGEYRAGIVIPKDFQKNIEEGIGSEIKLYVDKAKAETAIVSEDAMKAFIQDLNEQIGTQFIKSAWDQLNELNDRLDLAKSKLKNTQNQSISMESQIDDMIIFLESENLTLSQQYLQDFNQSISTVTPIISSINSTQSLDLNPMINELNTAIISLNTAINTLCIIPNPSCDSLQNLKTQLTTLRNSLVTQQTAIESLVNDQLVLIQEIQDMQDRITYMNTQLEDAEQFRSDTLPKLYLLKNNIIDYRNQSESLLVELEETTRTLDKYTSKDPSNIVRAVNLNTDKIYGNKKYIEIKSGSLVAMLLLFITLLIVSSNVIVERKTGTLARNLLSPTSLSTFLLGKIVYLTILGLVQLIVMFIVLSFMGVTINLSLALILVCLVSIITFITMGMFIGSLSESENTALLTSLVFAIPMMFLNGSVFPFEMMPSTIRFIGEHLPLTLSTISLERLLIYSTGASTYLLFGLIIYSIIFYYFAYGLIKKKIV